LCKFDVDMLFQLVLKESKMIVNNVNIETMRDILHFLYAGSIYPLKEENNPDIQKCAQDFSMNNLLNALDLQKQNKCMVFHIQLLMFEVSWGSFAPVLDSLFDFEMFCDVIISLESGKQVHAHKCILATRSPYLRRMFKSGTSSRISTCKNKGFQESQGMAKIEIKETFPEAALFL
jgi:hypothetical protein